MTHDSTKIRMLNDEFRRSLNGGSITLTPGITALGAEILEGLIHKLTTFDDFPRENDPYVEHDFGAFEMNGERIFFKIDYYDTDMAAHSPDPADPAVTKRVLTLMLANEY